MLSPKSENPMEGVTEKELKLLGHLEKYKAEGYGYFEIQKTKPQTLGMVSMTHLLVLQLGYLKNSLVGLTAMKLT